MAFMGTAEIQPVVETLRRCLDPRPEILEAYLFGSLARSEAQA